MVGGAEQPLYRMWRKGALFTQVFVVFSTGYVVKTRVDLTLGVRGFIFGVEGGNAVAATNTREHSNMPGFLGLPDHIRLPYAMAMRSLDDLRNVHLGEPSYVNDAREPMCTVRPKGFSTSDRWCSQGHEWGLRPEAWGE